MSILVSGGAGYIGSHTCIELLNAGGVLNTCKSNGIHRALLGGESGERVSNA